MVNSGTLSAIQTQLWHRFVSRVAPRRGALFRARGTAMRQRRLLAWKLRMKLASAAQPSTGIAL